MRMGTLLVPERSKFAMAEFANVELGPETSSKVDPDLMVVLNRPTVSTIQEVEGIPVVTARS